MFMLSLLFAAIAIASTASATERAALPITDRKGTKDSPLLKRYEVRSSWLIIRRHLPNSPYHFPSWSKCRVKRPAIITAPTSRKLKRPWRERTRDSCTSFRRTVRPWRLYVITRMKLKEWENPFRVQRRNRRRLSDEVLFYTAKPICRQFDALHLPSFEQRHPDLYPLSSRRNLECLNCPSGVHSVELDLRD